MTATRNSSDNTLQSFWAESIESLEASHLLAHKMHENYRYFTDCESGSIAWQEYRRAIFAQMVVIGKHWA